MPGFLGGGDGGIGYAETFTDASVSNPHFIRGFDPIRTDNAK